MKKDPTVLHVNLKTAKEFLTQIGLPEKFLSQGMKEAVMWADKIMAFLEGEEGVSPQVAKRRLALATAVIVDLIDAFDALCERESATERESDATLH